MRSKCCAFFKSNAIPRSRKESSHIRKANSSNSGFPKKEPAEEQPARAVRFAVLLDQHKLLRAHEIIHRQTIEVDTGGEPAAVEHYRVFARGHVLLQ